MARKRTWHAASLLQQHGEVFLGQGYRGQCLSRSIGNSHMPTGLRIRYGRSSSQLISLIIVLGVIGVIFWQTRPSGVAAVFWSSLGVAATLIYLSFWETEFSEAPPRIVRQWRFLGFIPIWWHQHPLGSFVGVERHQRPSSEHTLWMVGLIKRSGGSFAVQWFSSNIPNDPCPESRALVLHLSEITGLPSDEPAGLAGDSGSQPALERRQAPASHARQTHTAFAVAGAISAALSLSGAITMHFLWPGAPFGVISLVSVLDFVIFLVLFQRLRPKFKCPQCGKRLGTHNVLSQGKDGLTRVVCSQCQIEWELEMDPRRP